MRNVVYLNMFDMMWGRNTQNECSGPMKIIKCLWVCDLKRLWLNIQESVILYAKHFKCYYDSGYVNYGKQWTAMQPFKRMECIYMY